MFKYDPSESSKILRVSPVFAHAPNRAENRRDGLYAFIVAKVFLGDERNFLEPLLHFPCSDVRGLIVSHKTDHGPAHRRYRALQQ